jgi:hypothetical protein
MFTTKQLVQVGVVVIVFLSGSVASAQNSVKASSNSALARAIALHEEAVALYSQPKRSADAARLHVAEAKFRNSNDPEAVQALMMAGNLYNYAGQPFEAKKVTEQAAKRALAMGDVVTAAQAFTNATYLAFKIGIDSEVQRLGREAILLSNSPLITEQQREGIRIRFRNTPSFAALLK